MKANELMVNDWVRPIGCNPFRVGCVLGDAVCNDSDTQMWCDDEIEPIPLTPEILAKNAEHRTISGGYALTRAVAIRPISDEAFGVYGVMVGFAELPVRISYVHELQHALRLCKIEKEIVL